MKIAIIAVLVLLALAAAGGGGAAYFSSGGPVADHALAAVNKDVARLGVDAIALDKVLGTRPAWPAFGGSDSPQAFIKLSQQFGSTAASAGASLAQARQLIDGDQAAVNDAITKVGDAESDWATIPERGRLQAAATKLGYLRLALDLLGSVLQVAQSQLGAYTQLVNALAAFAGMAEKVEAHDFRGCLVAYDGVASALSRATDAAADAHFPDVWASIVAALNQLGADTKAACQFVLNGDAYGAQGTVSSINQDLKTMSALDTSQLDHNAYVAGLLAQIKTYEGQAGIG